MTSEKDGGPPPPKEQFREQLNKHGYAFQCAACDAVRKAFENRWLISSKVWEFQALEFPVAVQGSGTRVDLVLKRSGQDIYLLVECKRVDPSLADWCFARFPPVRCNRQGDVFLAEYFEGYGASRSGGARMWNFFNQAYYEIGLEVRNQGCKGNGTGGGRRAIEEAASQVCRGLNGMVECFAAHSELQVPAVFIPVIFTTARLWACDVNLQSETDLKTGRVEASKMTDLTLKEWIYYQYHQSPGIKHQYRPRAAVSGLGALMEVDYIRTVPIVTATEIESFLGRFEPGLLDFRVIS